MNERIKQLALNAGLLNYIDNETPRRYFINGHADIEEVKEFAELIVRECIAVHKDDYGVDIIGDVLKKHFGVEE